MEQQPQEEEHIFPFPRLVSYENLHHQLFLQPQSLGNYNYAILDSCYPCNREDTQTLLQMLTPNVCGLFIFLLMLHLCC